MISGCRQVISALVNAFSICIATYFNLHMPKFEKYHNLFEFERRQTIFFKIKCLELYEWCHAMYTAVSFLGVQSKSKHLGENKKSFHFVLRYSFWEFFERSKPLWPETCHNNPLSAAYFSVHPIGKCCKPLLLQEKNMSLLSTKWVKLTPKVGHFFYLGT